MTEKVVGILGGMGPEATVDLFAKIVAATPARTDQEHLRIIIDCNSKIPSRQDAVLAGGEDPTPLLRATARNLERAGADLIVIPCNSAHLYFDRIAEVVGIPILHIVRETVAEIQRRFPDIGAAGVLASTATVQLRLYHDCLEERDIRALSPPDADQETVQSVIFAVKAGDKGALVRERLRAVARRLAARGTGCLITGCTELSLILEDGDLGVPVVDPTLVLAEAAVRHARGRER